MEWRILDARFIQPNLRIIHAWVVILFVYLQSGLVAVRTHKGDLFKKSWQHLVSNL